MDDSFPSQLSTAIGDIVIADHADVLVLGGGVAGHRAAIGARETGARVTMMFMARGASPYIGGCNAALGHVDDRDGRSVYTEDMMRAGGGLNDPALVAALVDNAGQAIHELAEIGVPFARADDGRFAQRHLSGNTYPRSMYVPEGTGTALLVRLSARAQQLGTEVLNGRRIVHLLRSGGGVCGAMAWNDRKARFEAVTAGSVVLALGGIGRLYQNSTYPIDVCSDSYGLAVAAGASLIDMEFVQFEPLIGVWPDDCRGMTMPTAVLGDGAHLLNRYGERFMLRHNPEFGEKRIEKARLSICIEQEILDGNGFDDGSITLDTTVLPRSKLESYVGAVRRMRAAGIDPVTTPPRVRPAAHSQMGGIRIDPTGWSGIGGLFVAGEAAGGVHGASRLAGNGCSETIVFDSIAGRSAAAHAVDAEPPDIPAALDAFISEAMAGAPTEIDALADRIRSSMSAHVGMWRDESGLRQALAELDAVDQVMLQGQQSAASSPVSLVKAIGVRHMLTTGRAIIAASLNRKESLGAHQRTDTTPA